VNGLRDPARERFGPGGALEILTPEGRWAVIVHTSVRGMHLDHPDARSNFVRDKRRAFFMHLEEIRRVADAYDHAPSFYEDRRLLWREWELHSSIEGSWITELIVG
jgi:hypothetical protein